MLSIFTPFLTIYISSLEKCVFISSTHFLIRLLFFNIDLDKLFVYFGGIKPLSIKSFANVSSLSIRFFVLLMVSFTVKAFKPN